MSGNNFQLYAYDSGVSSNLFSGIWRLTRLMKASGWTYMASSNGAGTKDTTGTASNDLWGGNANPLLDTFPTAFNSTGFNNIAGPWIVLQGPGVLKLACTSAATGTFQINEAITQATSGATGEILGYVFDATNGGWIIVRPRTGTFDATHLITGTNTGATVTPTALTTYTQEVLFWKNSSGAGTGTVAWVYDVAGSSNLFSAIATAAAGCNSYAAPGFGGTGNIFPSTGLMVSGTTQALAFSLGTPATGTYTTTNGLTTITGTISQSWSAGDILVFSNQPTTYYAIASGSGTSWTLTSAYTGTGGSLQTANHLSIVSGTNISPTNGSAVVGTATDIRSTIGPGSNVMFNNQPNAIYQVVATSATNITLSIAYTGTTSTTARVVECTNIMTSDGWVIHDNNSTMSTTTHCMLVTTNATPSAGTSADGSWWINAPVSGNTVAGTPMGIMTLDGGEPGDASPFVWLRGQGSGGQGTTFSRLGTGVSMGAPMTWTNFAASYSSNSTVFSGWIAKGLGGSTDILGSFANSAEGHLSGSIDFAMVANGSDPMKVQNHPASVKPTTTEQPLLVSTKTGFVMFKGRARWIRLQAQGALFDTTDNKTWVVSISVSGVSNPAMALGPWDGSTVPTA